MSGTGTYLFHMQYRNKNENFSILYWKREIKEAGLSGKPPYLLPVFYFPSALNKTQKYREFCIEVMTTQNQTFFLRAGFT